MTRKEAIKHLKLMQSGARNAIRFTKNDKEISEEERKEDIEIYQEQLAALNMATNTLEQEPCENAVSRAEVIDELNRLGRNAFKDDADYDNFFAFLDSLTPVTPTRKKGKWIEVWDKDHIVILAYKCSECGTMRNSKTKYCADCGSFMMEED